MRETDRPHPAGIQTLYRGRNFRSRLEAKWAWLFDRFRWPWEYEPLDLNGYIPDFVLKFPDPVLVEVKPCLVLNELDLHREKIAQSGWKNEAIIVGATTWPCGDYDLPVIGRFALERWGGDWGWAPSDVALFWCRACGQIGFSSSQNSYRCRCCNVNDHHRSCEGVPEFLDSAWANAGNQTQWFKPNVA
jgi:hypothetical protein